jgi:protein-disulfide isomerase
MFKGFLFFVITILNYAPAATLAAIPPRGDSNAEIKITMFTDYQCPYSKRGNEIINELLKEQDVAIAFEIKQFPLDFHESARYAAKAALCSGEQGEFWEMHDKLFAINTKLTPEKIDSLTQTLRLDATLFKKCVSAKETEDAVDKDMKEAKENKFSGTPAFLISGPRGMKSLNGAYPKEEFKKIIETLR